MKTNPLLSFLLILALASLFFRGGNLQAMVSNPLEFVFLMLSILIALVIHEFFHALTADNLGDPNPRLAGRVSLNPLAHLDPLGSLLILFTGFGWGKPVQFDPYNLQNPVKEGAYIAAAGPASNFILAVILVILMRFTPIISLFPPLSLFLITLFSVNLNLAIFNLLPVYPLDGHHILRAFFTPRTRASYDLFNRRFGMIVAFALILPVFGGASAISRILGPILSFFYSLFLGF